MDGGDAGLRTGLDQRRHRPVDEESRGQLVHAAEQRVELANPGRDARRASLIASPAASGYGVGLEPAPAAPSERLQRSVRSLLQPSVLVGAVGGEVARHAALPAAAALSVTILTVERDDLLLDRAGRLLVESAWRRGSATASVRGDGDGGRRAWCHPAGLLRPGIGWPLLSRVCSGLRRTTCPAARRSGSPTITSCSCGKAVPPLLTPRVT